MASSNLQLQKVPLHFPSLEEVAGVLEVGLQANFEHASVCVVDCPDLTRKPFMLADQGLCGSPRVADVGGVPHLIPVVKHDKIYNLEKVVIIVILLYHTFLYIFYL